MPEQTIRSGAAAQQAQEAVRIHTRQIEDACIDKDCIEDLRVYLTEPSQRALEQAAGARARNADLIHVYIDVAPISYNRGHYTADLTFYYRIWGETVNPPARPAALDGLAVFTKRVVLYGGQVNVKVFSSENNRLEQESLYQAPVPGCVVEALDPMVLAAKLAECTQAEGSAVPEIPDSVEALFDAPLSIGCTTKQLLVTLGQFSTVRLERSAQLLIPAFAYTVPEKLCSDDAGTPDEPCDLFARVDFPTQAFYPGAEES